MAKSKGLPGKRVTIQDVLLAFNVLGEKLAAEASAHADTVAASQSFDATLAEFLDRPAAMTPEEVDGIVDRLRNSAAQLQKLSAQPASS